MEYYLREVLAEIIEPSGGDKPGVEIIDPNDPENKSKDNKMKYRPQASRIQIQGVSKRKMWMPGGNS
jgi:hypothetical protein